MKQVDLAPGAPDFPDPSKLKPSTGANGIAEKLAETKQFMVKVLIQTAQNTLPDFDGNGSNDLSKQIGESTNTIGMISQNEIVVESLTGLTKSMAHSQLLQAASLVNSRQTVHCDDSTHTLTGNEPVIYNYTVAIPPEYKQEFKKYEQESNGGGVNVAVKIIDEDGNVVYTEAKKASDGFNIFKWTGTKTDGTKATPGGKYRIELEGSISVSGADSMTTRKPVTITTTLSGTVESVTTNENKEIIFCLNGGKTISLAQVTKIELQPESTEEKSLADYTPYIGHEVTADLSGMEVQSGAGRIRFNNDKVDNPGNLIVNLYRNGMLEKTITYTPKELPSIITTGFNTVYFNALQHGIEDGKYEYDVLLEDTKKGHTPVQLDKHCSVIVKGVDTSGNIISTDGDTFDPHTITTIKAVNSDSTKFKGATVQYNKQSIIPYDAGTIIGEIVIPYPQGPTQGIQDLSVEICDAFGKEVRTIELSGADVYYDDVKAPAYGDLSDESRRDVDEYIERMIGREARYDTLEQPVKITMNNYITKQFKEGRYFAQSQGATDQIRLRNMGLVQLAWDGLDSTGKQVPYGVPYEYTITVRYNGGESAVIDTPAVSKVQSIDTKGKVTQLLLANGDQINAADASIVY